MKKFVYSTIFNLALFSTLSMGLPFSAGAKGKSVHVISTEDIHSIRQPILDLLNNPECQKEVLVLLDIDETLLSSAHEGQGSRFCQTHNKTPSKTDASCHLQNGTPELVHFLNSTPGITLGYLTARGTHYDHQPINHLTEITEREIEELGYPNSGNVFNASSLEIPLNNVNYSIRKSVAFTHWNSKGPFVAHLFLSSQDFFKEPKKCFVMVDDAHHNIESIKMSIEELPANIKPHKTLLFHYTFYGSLLGQSLYSQ